MSSRHVPASGAAGEFEIVGADNAEQHASNGHVSLTVRPDGPSRLRKRIAIKRAGTRHACRVQWLFGEIDGVRCYVHDDGTTVRLIMTRQDLYP
ncbi:MAG: hypothetical protein D6826_02495 [Alphaproteobacteria bacterium]|nr:MAG: hypothetical protein D6826_02495 [Alphaproteobacteria bacterium]